MIRRFSALVLVVSSSLLATTALCQVTKQGNGYLFRLNLKKGQAMDFAVPCTIGGVSTNPLKIQFAMHMKVLEVKPSGLTTIFMRVDTGTMQLPGIDKKGGSFVVDRRGRVEDEGSSPMGFCVIYPKDPVKVGGTFVAPVPSAIGGGLAAGGGNSQATFKLLGFSGSGVRQCARLAFKVANAKAPGGVILVRLSDGVIEKYYTKFVATVAENTKPVSVVATIQRR